MKLFILSPNIRTLPSIAQECFAQSDLVLMTNPLYQKDLQSISKARCVIDEDYIDGKRLAELIERAKSLAWNWFDQEGFREGFLYRDIDLRCLFTHDLTIYFVKALKIVDLYQFLLKDCDIDRINIVDDGSEWASFAERIAKLRKIPFEKIVIPMTSCVTWKIRFEKWAKTVLKYLSRYFSPRIQKGKVLYSAALRFVRPFLVKNEGGYYLRGTFSAEAWQMSLKHSFTHLLPENFKTRLNLAEGSQKTDGMIATIEEFFRTHLYFTFQKMDLWPIIAPDILRMAKARFMTSMQLIDQFRAMFDRVQPQSVLVEEEVCFFNKNLVYVANALKIPTYCLVHGAPGESVGSVPSAVKQIFVWGATSRARLLGWGVPEDRMVVTGAPQYRLSEQADYAACRALIEKKLQIRKEIPYILFCAFPFDTNVNPTFFLTSLGTKIQETALAVAIEVLKTHTDLHLVLKFHPSDLNIEFSEKIIEKTDVSIKNRVHFVKQFEASVLIAGAKTVFTTASTMYVEALLQEKPGFLLDLKSNRFGDFLSEHFLNLEDPSECVRLLNHRLDSRHIREGIELQRSDLRRHFFNDNRDAVDRVWEIISKSPGKEV